MVWFAQEHPASCVAACLRMVLTNFGQHRSESAIRRVLGNPRFGITLTQAADKLLAAGAVAQWHVDWGLDDIRDSLRDGECVTPPPSHNDPWAVQGEDRHRPGHVRPMLS